MSSPAASGPAAPGYVAPSARESQDLSGITVPSFLGLNTPPGGSRGDIHAGRNSDPLDGRDSLRASSRNLDYLLEDENEPKRGWGKLFLFVIALLLALGFGYLRFKQGGFDFLKVGEKKPAVTTETGQSSADSGSAAPTATTPDSSAPQAGAGNATATTPSAGVAATKPADASAAPTTPAQGDSQTSAQAAPQSTPPQSSQTQTTPPQTTPAQAVPQAVPSQAPSPQAPQPAASQPPSAADSGAADSATKTASSDSDKPLPSPEAAAPSRARPAKPVATPKPAAGRPFDSVAEAERYIYGRGVAQDCDHGLRLLKPAAQSDPKAMISMGALYSTGTCTPRDLPTAYRWFAMALHKQPDNQVLQDDLQNLWSKMTPPERQLAIKLSQ